MTQDPVLNFEHTLRHLAAERELLCEEHARREVAGGSLQEIDAAFVDLSLKWHPAMRGIADTPADTLDGIAAKLRVLATTMLGGGSDYDEDILLLAIADLERLSAASH